VRRIANRIADAGSVALIIGHSRTEPAAGDTLQAMRVWHR
jgi:hypothetical protein